MHAQPFVDAHVHLWDLDHISYPWLTPPFSDEGINGSTEAIAHTYLLDDYLADARNWNVAGIVHIDAGAVPDAAIEETRWLQAMADARGMPNAIVAFAALDDPHVDALLGAQAAHPNVRGIRHIINWHADPAKTYTPRNLLEDPAWHRGYALLARHGLSFDAQLYPGQFAAMAALAQRHTDIPVMLNHAGMPIDGYAEWRAAIKPLARCPHVAVKISGFGIVDHHWSTDSIRRYVLETIALFGTDRCMFASDFPTDKLHGDFDRVMGAYAAIVADFSEAERHALFAGNAARLYRLDLQL